MVLPFSQGSLDSDPPLDLFLRQLDTVLKAAKKHTIRIFAETEDETLHCDLISVNSYVLSNGNLIVTAPELWASNILRPYISGPVPQDITRTIHRNVPVGILNLALQASKIRSLHIRYFEKPSTCSPYLALWFIPR